MNDRKEKPEEERSNGQNMREVMINEGQMTDKRKFVENLK